MKSRNLPSSIKFILYLLLLFPIVSQAQDDYVMVHKASSEARLISVDQLGFVYLVVKNNILKYDRNGKFINQYSNQRYGEISSIDATDPYKIIVFYEGFRTIIILDNMLSENGSPLDMQFSDFDQPTLACRAYNTGVWLYDQVLYTLYRMTLSQQEVQRTGNLAQILGYRIQPNFMKEYNNQLYLNNPETGILMFDQFGTYVKNIPIKNLKSFQVTEKAIFFNEGDEIHKYPFRTRTVESLLLPEDKITGIGVDKNRLYIITGKYFKIYDYKN